MNCEAFLLLVPFYRGTNNILQISLYLLYILYTLYLIISENSFHVSFHRPQSHCFWSIQYDYNIIIKISFIFIFPKINM